jgi:hypothetical protein
MSNNVVEFGGITRLDVSPDRLLEKAIGQLESVLIIGYTKEGDEYFASSKADASEPIYFCERAKHRLMKMIDEMQEINS